MRSKRHIPVEANRSLAILSSLMTTAIELGWRESNPCNRVQAFREQAKDEWLDESDLPKFVNALATFEGPFYDCLRFALVTGWRIGEVLNLQWGEVDLPKRIARLTDSKTGPCVKSLAADAVAVIEAQPGRIGFVFSENHLGMRPLSYESVLHRLGLVCTKAGVKRITPHTLRRSAATWLVIAGASAHELKETFNWKSSAVADRYIKRSQSLAAKGSERLANVMNVLQRQA